MTILRYIFSIAVLLMAVYIVVINWCCVVVSLRNARRGIDRHHSTVPIISVFLTAFAILLYPQPGKAAWMLAVPVLDIAHLSLVIWVLLSPVLIVRMLRKKKPAPPAEGASGG